jgi:citronellol/citronellal dehydrogenase
VAELKSLEGKVCIVTGASRGIGKALAIALAEQGARVVLAAKTVDPDPRLPGTLADVKREIDARARDARGGRGGGEALLQPTDVRDEAQIVELIEAAADKLGGIDVLINNAGALYWAPVEQTPAKRFDLVMQVNVRASFLCAHYAIPHMRKRGGGHVINMSPPVTASCSAGRVAYMVSKFGMSMLTEGLAEEVKADNIKVHSLWPVTMVESQATIGHHLGEPSMWRAPTVLVDATLALLTGASPLPSGSAVYDEEVLASIGVTDLSKYAAVPGTEPPRMRLDDPTSYWQKRGAG